MSRSPRPSTAVRERATRPARPTHASIAAQLETIERGSGDGILVFGRGVTLPVSSLDRLVWPKEGITKGALMRYYAAVAPGLLPLLRDRPLVLERHPAGMVGPAFHQHAPGDNTPPSVRTADVALDDGTTAPRFIGGDLATLLYTIQLGAIAVHPWHARLGHLEWPDYMALDLDPMPRVPHRRVLELARTVSDVLGELGLAHALKTSGSRGFHLVVPLPARTSWDVSARLAERVALRVVERQPSLATVERRLDERPARSIYVDHMQNARGKTLVAAYSARARVGAPVSAPVGRAEIDRGEADPRGWTVETLPPALVARRRLWTAPFRAGNDAQALRAALRALR